MTQINNPTAERAGLALRHAGQQANLAAGTKAHQDDRARVVEAVAMLAHAGQAFTADDVHRRITAADDSAYNGNLVSSVLGQWSKDGRIRRVEGAVTVSTRPSRRSSRNQTWCGAGAGTERVPSRSTGEHAKRRPMITPELDAQLARSEAAPLFRQERAG